MNRVGQMWIRCAVLVVWLLSHAADLCAQDSIAVIPPKAQLHREQAVRALSDSLLLPETDTLRVEAVFYPEEVDAMTDSLQAEVEHIIIDSLDTLSIATPADFTPQRWIPNPKKAMWLAIVFPGAGQIYNRKYWKLPLFYGGFIGCVYAISWNNTMYRDYSQAYIDIMDDDPNTKSYENFLPLNYNAQANQTRLQELFRKKKDYYRRYRDLSIFATIGVYLLSVLDAYIDAELSSFDISRDLSMKVRPSVINHHHYTSFRGNAFMNSSYGIQCSLRF